VIGIESVRPVLPNIGHAETLVMELLFQIFHAACFRGPSSRHSIIQSKL
jgi:hypothetical protein